MKSNQKLDMEFEDKLKVFLDYCDAVIESHEDGVEFFNEEYIATALDDNYVISDIKENFRKTR